MRRASPCACGRVRPASRSCAIGESPSASSVVRRMCRSRSCAASTAARSSCGRIAGRQAEWRRRRRAVAPSSRPFFLGFRKPLNSPALRIVVARDAGLQPATGSRCRGRRRAPAPCRWRARASSPSCRRSRPPKRLSLSLQKRDALDGRRRARCRRACRSARPASAARAEPAATAAFASQSSASQGCSNSSMPDGIEARGERDALARGR